MGEFKAYMLSGHPISDRALDELLRRFEWFSAARVLRAARNGTADGRLSVTASSRALGPNAMLPVNGAKLLELSSEELIDRFLGENDLRIVAQEGEPGDEIRTEAEISDEDDLVSEELAEIYLAQGLRGEALVIYRKLSLLNPEKSVYFAGLIEKVETNN